jgi:hypothetical protein
MFETEARYTAFAPNLALIPPSASVASQNNLTPHLSHRRYIYNVEFEGIQNADYVALDDASVGRSRALFDEQVKGLEALGYREIASGDGLAILQRH